MKFSRLIFPAPNPPSYSQEHLVGELLYVPKDFRECPYKYIKRDNKRISRLQLQQNAYRSTQTTPRNLNSSTQSAMVQSGLLTKNASNNSILREISENASSSNVNSRRTDKSRDTAGKIKLHPSISTKSILISTEGKGKDKNNKNGNSNTSQEQGVVSSSNSTTSNSNKNQRNIGLPPKSNLKVKKITNLNQSQAYMTNTP